MLGWRSAFASEIDPFPRAVLAHHYPDVPLHGDFTTIRENEYAAVDVLCGGTPCQSFSVAGLRGGMEDARGNLALEYLRLAARLRPRWLVWENVPGVRSSNAGRDFGAFLGGLGQLGYGWAYRSLDAQYFNLAQRRERVFVIGHLGDWRRAAAVLFEPASLRGDIAPSRKSGESVAPTIAGCSNGGGANGPGRDVDSADSALEFRQDGVANAILTPNGGRSGINVGAVAFAQNQRDEVRLMDVAGSCSAETGAKQQTYCQVASGVRRLTPRECERLMGFPDDYTLIPWRKKMAADGPRYKALGNSMAVPVMRWIGQRIAAVS